MSTRRNKFLAAAALIIGMGVVAQEGNPACVPVKKGEGGKAMTARALAQKPGETVPLLLLGDSITQCWLFPKDHQFPGGLDAWNKYFVQAGAVNFGISGDRTEHLLWRITEGEQLKINPKIIVLLIGTNNLHREKKADSAEQTAEGIKLIVDTIRKKLPDCKILLLGVLPRSWDVTAKNKIPAINAIIKDYADNKHVFYFDAAPALLEKDGSISKEIFRDGLHLSPRGYELFAEALLPEIKKLQNAGQ
jgi:lysophospholipase L1-like esterase